ncbi:hypothetical protein D3C76_1503700 [compost metagenome]
MKDVGRLDVAVGQVDRCQLPQLRLIDEHPAMALPVGGNGFMHSIVAGIFGDKDFANGRCVVPIKTLERELQQIEPTTAGDDEGYITFLAELHPTITPLALPCSTGVS